MAQCVACRYSRCDLVGGGCGSPVQDYARTSYFDRAVRVGQARNPGPGNTHLDSASASGISEDSGGRWSIQDQYEALGGQWTQEHGCVHGDQARRSAPARPGAEFVAASRFTGAKDGMYFTTGTMGTGYYRDRPKGISLCRGVGVPEDGVPVTLRLDKLIERQVNGGGEDEAHSRDRSCTAASPAKIRKHRAARRGARLGCATRHPKGRQRW